MVATLPLPADRQHSAMDSSKSSFEFLEKVDQSFALNQELGHQYLHLNRRLVEALQLLHKFKSERDSVKQELAEKEAKFQSELEKEKRRFLGLKREFSRESQKVFKLEKLNRELVKRLQPYDSGVSSLASTGTIDEQDGFDSSTDELQFDKSDDFIDNDSTISTPLSRRIDQSYSTPTGPEVRATTVSSTPTAPCVSITLTPDLNQSRRQSVNPYESLCKPKAKIGKNLLETQRKHEFQVKKALKSVSCCVCGNSVGFCSNYCVCPKCKSVTHTHCKSKLNTLCTFGAGASCLTPGSRKSLRYDPGRKSSVRGSQYLLVGDFVLLKERPFIPAFLVKCCEDLVARVKIHPTPPTTLQAIRQTYSSVHNPIAKKQINSLLEKLLRTKAGIPSLDKEDSSVIGAVIVNFLTQLSEPLISNVLSRDFATAVVSTDQSTKLQTCLSELPRPNIDTLSFIMLHLYQLIDLASTDPPIGAQIKSHLISIFHVPIASYVEFENTESGRHLSTKILSALFESVPRAEWTNFLTI